MSRRCTACGTEFPDEVAFCGHDGSPTIQVTPPGERPDPRLGTKLGDYVVVAHVADGAMGAVYEARNTQTRQRVAIKVLHPDVAEDEVAVERFKREYETAGMLDHPNVVKVIDADFIPGNGPPFIVFEYIDGIDVGEMIDGNLFAPEDALELARQVVSGLVHLHEAGVFHCDIKPRNLLWTDRGVKIIDFNVAVFGASGDRGGGSRRYLPPDLDLDAVPTTSDLADRDLYALGITLYEAVTGRYPWGDAQIPPPGKRAPDPREQSNLLNLAPELADIMVKAIAPERADRFASAAELMNALAAVPAARRPPQPTTPVPPAWGAPD
ncbi:MAG TPA: serine/threonine-protein kinase, partial [Sandaracinaceae bacterium]